MTNDLIRDIAKEYHFSEIKSGGKNYISFMRYYARGHVRINFYEDIQILYLSITKLMYKRFQSTYPTHNADLVWRIFKTPNNMKR